MSNNKNPGVNFIPLRFQRPTDLPDLAIFPDAMDWQDTLNRKADPVYMYTRPIMLREDKDSDEDDMDEDLAVLSGATQAGTAAQLEAQQALMLKKQQKVQERAKRTQQQFENQVLTMENVSKSLQCVGRVGNLDLSAAQGNDTSAQLNLNRGNKPTGNNNKTAMKDFKYVVFQFVNRQEVPGGPMLKEINVTPIDDAYIFRKHNFNVPDLLTNEIDDNLKSAHEEKIKQLKRCDTFLKVFSQREREAEENKLKGGSTGKARIAAAAAGDSMALDNILLDNAFSMGSKGKRGRNKKANADEMDYSKMHIGDMGYSAEDLKNPDWIGGDYDGAHADDEEHNIVEEQAEDTKNILEDMMGTFEDEDEVKEEDLDDVEDSDEEGKDTAPEETKRLEEKELLKDGSGFVNAKMLDSAGDAVLNFRKENEFVASSAVANKASHAKAGSKHALSDSPSQPASKKLKTERSNTSSSSSSSNEYFLDEASVYRFIVERGGSVLVEDLQKTFRPQMKAFNAIKKDPKAGQNRLLDILKNCEFKKTALGTVLTWVAAPIH